MKKHWLINPQYSLADRITFVVVLTIIAIFIILTMIVTGITQKAMVKMSTQHALSRMEIANQKINSTFIGVETAVDNVVPEVEFSLNEPDRIYKILSRLLELNPSIIGTAVAFEPNYYPERGEHFSPYAYRTADSTIVCKQLGSTEYEYHYMDWYLIPKLLNKKCWSEPYYDKGGGEQMMATYSLPLYDKDGKFYAIVTADISVSWLTDMMKKNDVDFNEGMLNKKILLDNQDYDHDLYYKHAYSFIIGYSGAYITHPEKERILNETYFVSCFETPDSTDDQVGYHMLDGMTGTDKFSRDGNEYVLAYAPIERTGWSMATVIPYDAITQRARILATIIMVVMIIGVLVIYFICRIMLRRMTKPLERFSKSAKEIAKGNFDAPLPEIKTKDEMRELYDSFKIMQHSLTSHIEELKVANEQKGRMEGELQSARNIQMSMIPNIFPAFPERHDLDIYAELTPAKAVGGDLYDFLIRKENLYFCIGDVSGKGVPASMLMAVTRSLFRMIVNSESDPVKIVSLINDSMGKDNDEMMFVTLFLGVLDLTNGHLSYCNAGHCSPIILGNDITILPCNPNIPVGIAPQFPFVGEQTNIEPGTTIFLYTDGLTEAENIDHLQFEEERVMAVAQESANLTPVELVNKMGEAVHQFVKEAEQSDDLTMFAIRYMQDKNANCIHQSLTLPNDIEAIPEMSEFVEQMCSEAGVSASDTMSIVLAIEEAVVNVMQYAYPQGTKGDVILEAVADDKHLDFIISDYGIPFDPTKKEKVDTTLSAEERPIGGLGIHLVREIMDAVNYEYSHHKNILSLRKNLK